MRRGIVIDDSYNANPLSAHKSLRFLNSLASLGFEVWGVWGDMLELGSITSQAHQEFLRELKESSLSRALLVGEEMKKAAEAIAKKEIQEGRFLLFSTSPEAQEFLAHHPPRGKQWAILFKGSRKVELERAIPPEWERAISEIRNLIFFFSGSFCFGFVFISFFSLAGRKKTI